MFLILKRFQNFSSLAKNKYLIQSGELNKRKFILTSFSMSQQHSSDNLQKETSIIKLLKDQFPEESGDVVKVEDISGGCGAMFRVSVESTQFEGIPKVKQHKIINEVLKKEIKEMHGIVIETKPIVKK